MNYVSFFLTYTINNSIIDKHNCTVYVLNMENIKTSTNFTR